MFKHPFSFNGRIGRSEFGFSFIIYLVVSNVLSTLVNQGGSSLIILLYIPTGWFLWAQGAKRCHDLGKSVWWQIVPLFGFWLVFKEGDIYPNEYGYNPKSAYSPDNNNQPILGDDAECPK